MLWRHSTEFLWDMFRYITLVGLRLVPEALARRLPGWARHGFYFQWGVYLVFFLSVPFQFPRYLCITKQS